MVKPQTKFVDSVKALHLRSQLRCMVVAVQGEKTLVDFRRKKHDLIWVKSSELATLH